MKKKCSKCLVAKVITEFRKRRVCKNGVNSQCKDCCRKYEKKWIAQNYSRWAKQQKKWISQNRGHYLEVQRVGQRKYYRKWPQKTKAHYAVQLAIKAGKLKRQPCNICGNELSEAHHPDYSKPLEIQWLCKRHHTTADKGVFLN